MKLMETIYKLKQVENKFYVGRTKNFELRFLRHQSGEGSMWTKKYKVLGIEEKIEVPEEYSSGEETKHTLQMMLKYGINNVRGAEYCLLRNYSIEEIAFPMSHHLKMEYKEIQEQLKNQKRLALKRVLEEPIPIIVPEIKKQKDT